jgi:DNA-binding transcriptional regulator YiaG
MLNYKGCGLRNVWLSNGYRKRSTAHGEAVAIPDVPGLHRVIALHIIKTKPRLSGAEFRFIRKELDLSQARLGQMFGYSSQAIALWEKRGNVPRLADRTLRAIYREVAEGNAGLQELVERLNDLDRKDHEKSKMILRETEKGWQAKAA